jgi:hypothetical protein
MIKEKEKFQAILRFPYHLQVSFSFKDAPESLTNQEVIIGNEDAAGIRRGFFPFNSSLHDNLPSPV